jgi:hypothetical protein
VIEIQLTVHTTHEANQNYLIYAKTTTNAITENNNENVIVTCGIMYNNWSWSWFFINLFGPSEYMYMYLNML